MKPFVDTVRAVAGEFAGRSVHKLLFPFATGGAVVTLVLVWLVHFSLWWLLLAVPLWFVICFGVALLVTAHILIGLFRPEQTKVQRSAVSKFVDKLQRVADAAGTPVFWLLFRAVRDVVWPRQNGFVGQLTHDSISLPGDLLRLQRQFSTKPSNIIDIKA